MNFRSAIIFSMSFALASTFQSARAQEVLTLENAQKIALERNNQLKIARLNVDAAKAVKTASKSSMFPGIGVGVTGFYLGKPLNIILPEYGLSTSLGINQTIYGGGKIRLAQLVAEKQLEMQEVQEVLSSSEVLLNVEKSYWLVVSLNAKLSLAAKYKGLLQAFLNDLTNSFNAGTTYKNDVLRVQVQFNNADLNLLKAKDDLTIAKLYLAQSVGLSDSMSFVVNDSVGSILLIENEHLINAGSNRPEVRLLNKAIEEEQLNVKVLQADLKPTIGYSANGIAALGKAGINPNDANKNFLNTYYGLLNINIPVWDWGATREKVKAQRLRVAAQQIQLEETQQLISVEVQQAYLQLNESYKRIGSSRISLDQAEENLRLSNDRFAAGTVLSKDVLEAQNLWEQANSNLLDAKVAYKINEAILKKALAN